MIWIILIIAVVIVFYLIYRKGTKLSDELHMDPGTYTASKGWEAIKHKKQAEKLERQNQEEWAKVGKAMGNERLGKTMGQTLSEMTDECPVCGGPIWNEASKCGHCGAPLNNNNPPD